MSAPTPREEGLSAKVNMAEAAEWIAKRRELLAEFLKSYRGKRHDSTGLSILAMSDLPRALDALEAVLKEVWRIESGHHFHGTTCTCGYASHRARDRTEHLTRPLTDAIETALRAES